MKKLYKLFIAIMAGTALFASCVKEQKIFDGSAPVTISVRMPEEGLAKVSVTQNSSDVFGAMKTAFEDTDFITVKNADNEDLSVVFTYQSGAGTTSAQFKAESGVAALAGATSYNIYLSSHMSGGFNEQTQSADNNSDHLGYSVKLSGVNTYEDATFTQAWASAKGGSLESSSVLRIQANLPDAGKADAVRKVTLKATSPVFNGENELVINVTTPGVSGDSKVVTLFATLPAGDVVIPANTEILFQFQVSDDVNDKYTAHRKLGSAMTLASGQVNMFKINCPNILSYANESNTDIGTENNPYLIGDRHQLDKMRDEILSGTRVYFKMVDDVDLDTTQWEPVNQSADYQIDFSGGGHTISNLSIPSTNSSSFTGFFGLLHGRLHDVVFDGANVHGGDDDCVGILAGRSGASSYAADFSNVTIRNSSLATNSEKGSYVGGFIGYVKKSNSFSKCQIIDSEITSSRGNKSPSLIGGLVGWMGPNGGCTLTDCSAVRLTVSGGCTNVTRSGVGGLIGRIEGSDVVISRCHFIGTLAPANTNNVGGLVGHILSGSGISILNSYSSGEITRGYTQAGGLVGAIEEAAGVTVNHCMSSDNLKLKGGYGGKGGLVGVILGSGVTIKESIAWNGSISAGHATNDSSSGAVVGYCHPNCILTNNYRKPGITYNGFYWAPSESFDHADVNGTTTPLLVPDGTTPYEDHLVDGTASGFSSSKYSYSYHGNIISNGAVVSPDNTYGWVSDKQVGSISVPTEDDPENPSYTGNNVWGLGSTTTVVDGVQYTHFHGTWQGEVREINIITTELNAHNKLKIYYNYKDEGLLYLDEKCNYVSNAVAATNGAMTSQFVRVDDVVKGTARSSSEWTSNCALTIDGDDVDIVKVASHFEAAMLPNSTVASAGPLLVWKGNKLTASQAWIDAAWNEEHTENWLTAPHPRTAIGINKEGTKLIQVTVDGRWGSSNTNQRAIGMATDLLAELMLELGCYKAMNLDGGGGTQMWVYGMGDKHNIVNHPHNEWPTYGSGSGKYYWIKDNEVGRRTSCCAVYIQSDLK